MPTTDYFLCKDRVWRIPPSGGGVSDGDKGDITVTGTGTIWTVDNNAITDAKLAGSISNSKLTTNPLDRTNHTGSQAQSTITNLTTDLAGKANSTHIHPESDITNLVSDLSAKENSLPSKTGNSLKYLQVNAGENGFQYGTPAGGSGPSYVRLTADRTNSTTTLADATGLSFSVTSGLFYIFEFSVIFQSNTTTTGIKFAVNGPTNNFFTMQKVIPTSLIANQAGQMERVVNTAATASTGVDTVNVNLLAYINGVINPTANGTIIVRFAAETTGTVTIKSGSMGILHTVP